MKSNEDLHEFLQRQPTLTNKQLISAYTKNAANEYALARKHASGTFSYALALIVANSWIKMADRVYRS